MKLVAWQQQNDITLLCVYHELLPLNIHVTMSIFIKRYSFSMIFSKPVVALYLQYILTLPTGRKVGGRNNQRAHRT